MIRILTASLKLTLSVEVTEAYGYACLAPSESQEVIEIPWDKDLIAFRCRNT